MSASTNKGAPYTVSGKEILAKVPGLQAVRFVMAPGESTPWHYHNQVRDQFFCLAGPLVIEVKDGNPAELECGGEFAVEPQTVHRVVNPGPGAARYLLIQGVGDYDFVAAPGDAA